MVVILESKLSSNSKTPNIQNFTTVRNNRRQGQGSGLLPLIHKSINFFRKPESPETLVEPHLEELTITATLGDTELIITNVYIPPASSCTGGYLPSLGHLMMTTATLILGDFNAHHSTWYSSSTDTRGTLLENIVSGSNFGILNWDSPTRLPGNANPSRHIPSGRHCINTEPVPAEILERMRARDDLRSRDLTSPALQQMNDKITRTTNSHRKTHGDSSWRHWTI